MENIESYRNFAENLTPTELQNVMINIHDEERWRSLTPNNRFFTALSNDGVNITSEEEMDIFSRIIYRNLRKAFPSLPAYTTKVEGESGRSFEELDWIPGEPIAFDISNLEDPFYLTFPERIVQGEQEGGFRLVILRYKNESKRYTLYSDSPVLALWSNQHKLLESSLGYPIVAEDIYSGKEAINKRIESDIGLKRYAEHILRGKISEMKKEDKRKLKDLLQALK